MTMIRRNWLTSGYKLRYGGTHRIEARAGVSGARGSRQQRRVFADDGGSWRNAAGRAVIQIVPKPAAFMVWGGLIRSAVFTLHILPSLFPRKVPAGHSHGPGSLLMTHNGPVFA